MRYSQLISTGSYLPDTIKSNDDLSQIMDTSDEWIRARTGIQVRHIADEHESSTDLAYEAAVRALKAASMSATELDLIIVATCTPTHIFPSNATQLQARLGCRLIPTFDLSAACAGFMYALATADSYIRAGIVQRALVVGTEVMSNIIDWQDRNTAVLFGDGAGAVVLSASNTPGIYNFSLHSDGAQSGLLIAPRGSGSPRAIRDSLSPYIEMQGREVFKLAVRTLSALVMELLEKCQLQAQDIDFLIPHQANLRIIKAIAEHLGLEMDKVIITVDRHANTSAASVPLALDCGICEGKIQRGDTLLLEAFGGGFTWGGCLLTY